MPIMQDSWIRQQAEENGMIEPFVNAQQKEDAKTKDMWKGR